MSSNNTKIRITLNSFSTIKGICVICAILVHVVYRYPVEDLIFPIRLIYGLMPIAAGAMPMFFIIGGYGFKEKTIKKVFKVSAQSLLKPYLVVMLLFVSLYPFTFRLWYGEWAYGLIETRRYLIAFLLGIAKPGKEILGYQVYHCTAMWFFLAFFVATNLLNAILKVKNQTVQLLVVILLAITGYELLIHDINYYCIGQGLMATGYFYAGYMMKKYDLLSKCMSKRWIQIMLLAAAVAITAVCDFDLAQGQFKYGLVDYVVSYFAGVFLMCIGLYLQRFNGKVIDWFEKLGLYTYWVICIHAIENDAMQWWAYKNHVSNINVAFVGEFTLKLLIISVACYVLKRITLYKYSKAKR